MAYTVIARRWRPQTLDQVVGQRHVTQTLRNAFGSGRIAQAFVFAGPRGVGKTTTARILARMLNCDQGPTADPCGTCDSCREIAEGRDMDVLEIDAATHTGIDNIREVIIAGLAIRPARDRYKVFIIDEVHQLSTSSFNALLKSIEEPPPHVAFIMATTAPDKIPDTIVSRSQVFEFKTIASRGIAEQLQKIAETDGITVSHEAIALVARAAEGSMRDAETAFDQVLAFAGNTVTVDDVATVLGLVGRDLLFDMVTAVADEDGTQAFELAGRAVEAGYDLRLLCRETSRLVRDLLLLKVDATRMNDADVAPEPDRARLSGLLPRFSQEDLLRAFDLLSKAEYDIKNATEPRYQLEMALLRWIHLRKLTPLATLVEQLSSGSGLAPGGRPSGGGLQPPSVGPRPAAIPPRSAPASSASVAKRVGGAAPAGSPAARPAAPPPASKPVAAPPAAAPRPARADAGTHAESPAAPVPADQFVPAYLAALQADRPGTYGTIVAQGRGVELRGDKIVIKAAGAFVANQANSNKPWLESIAQQVAGRRLPVIVEVVEAGPSAGGAESGAARGPAKDDLMAAAKANPAVQTLLEIFPAEVKDVTELK
jgi:DNA polymerase III subunit gamma/tau